MYIRKLKIVVVFVMALLYSAAAYGSVLKPGEIIYSRAATVPGGNCDTATIWAVGQDGSNDRLITSGLHPRISPDGRFILFKRYPANVSCDPFLNGAPQWWMRDLARGREAQILENVLGVSFGHIFSLETNRADNQIIYNDGSAICTMNLDGANRVCFIGNIGQLIPIREPRQLSVRGSDSLVALADYNNNNQPASGLYTLNYDLSNKQKINNTSYGDLNPSWSNDGLLIAYGITNNSNRGAKGPFINLFTIKQDGTSKTQLTFQPEIPGEGFYNSLVWTLDNATIIDAAKINGVAGIYKISASGSGILGMIPITPGAPPDWVGGIAPVYSEAQVAAFGGGLTLSGNFSLVDTAGQGFAGQTSIGGSYNFESGFWAIPADGNASPTDTPTGSPTNSPTNTSTNTPTATPTATPAGTITGTITYGNAIPAATRFVSHVLMSGTGSVPVSVFTDGVGPTAGQYLLSGFGAGSYTVTPGKTGGVNGAIGSFDAARIAQHSAGPPNPQLTGNQLLVADVSGNGIISSFDAGQVAKFVAGPPYASPGIGSTGTWKFTPASRSYPSVAPNITGEDYSALLMGDVTGNWANTGARPVGSETALGIAVNAPNMMTIVDSAFIIPVSVQGAVNKGIISYEFDLRYDPWVIQPRAEPIDVAGTLSRGLSAVANAEEPGLLRVVIYGPKPISDDGVLLNLRFTAVGAPGSASPLTWERLLLNEGSPQAFTADGRIEISNSMAFSQLSNDYKRRSTP